jgi:hypothetical protein
MSTKNEPTDQPHEDEMTATKAVAVPQRATSLLGEFPHPDHPGKSKSWLQRHGLSFTGNNSLTDTQRSPVGAIRQNSGVNQQITIDTEKVKDVIHKKEEAQDEGIPWHLMNLEELKAELKMNNAVEQGLSSDEHSARLQEYGPNTITPKESISMGCASSSLFWVVSNL